jgi:hypothetical protein
MLETHGDASYLTARALSLASAAASRDTTRDAAAREKLAEQNAARAVALLLRARSQGFFQGHSEVNLIQKDRELEPLRRRADYQKLLQDLNK